MPKRVGSSRSKRRYVRFTRWRRRRFFALLAESGNVRMACELSGVGLGCVYRLRRTEPGFIARMAAAVAGASGRLAGGRGKGAPPPPCGWSPSPTNVGEDFSDERWAVAPPPDEDDVVIRRGIGGRLRVMAAGTRWWAARHDAIFLGHLRATGNVALAARAAGWPACAVYRVSPAALAGRRPYARRLRLCQNATLFRPCPALRRVPDGGLPASLSPFSLALPGAEAGAAKTGV
jgi:hypothetical protein